MAISEKIAGYTLLGMDGASGSHIPLPGPAQTGHFRDNLARLRQGGKLPKGTKEPTEFHEALAARRVAQENARMAEDGQSPATNRPRWKAGNPVMDTIYGAHDRVAAMPTPGGIGALVVVLLALLIVIMPISGHDTRMALLFKTLIGQRRLVGEQGVTAITPTPSTTTYSGGSPAASGTGSGPEPAATGTPMADSIMHIVPELGLPLLSWMGVA